VKPNQQPELEVEYNPIIDPESPHPKLSTTCSEEKIWKKVKVRYI
jgi:hypothetical protein